MTFNSLPFMDHLVCSVHGPANDLWTVSAPLVVIVGGISLVRREFRRLFPAHSRYETENSVVNEGPSCRLIGMTARPGFNTNETPTPPQGQTET